jgi:hypothetical protein
VVRRFGLGIDCADPASLARFWAEALGYSPPDAPQDEQNAFAVLEPREPGLPDVVFQRVPEGKVAKNRVHLDLRVGGDGPADERREKIDAEAGRLVALGASDHRGPIEEGGLDWVRMNDPEGIEFCLVGG